MKLRNLVPFLVLASVARGAWAEGPAPAGYPLQGLQAVTVSVLEPPLMQPVPELKAAALQALAEKALRAGGVPIPQSGPAPQLSYLQLRVIVIQGPTGTRGYVVNLRLMEVVSLSRDPKLKTQAAIWDYSVGGPADPTT